MIVSILVLLDVCKEQDTLKGNRIIAPVSILVLLDVCKERTDADIATVVVFEFQSLFYWMYVKNIDVIRIILKKLHVSILVLLDVCKEQNRPNNKEKS